MISVSVMRGPDGKVRRFELKGHAEYDEPGADVVCAAVSMLVINTINSIESFTDDGYVSESDEEEGWVSFEFKDKPSADADILIRSMLLGLQSVEESYGNDYINILLEEVQ